MNLATGDIVLYSGRHPLHLRQQQLTGCRWSQVGLVFRHRDIREPCVFESTKLSECHDVRVGTVIRGVQIARLAERVATFPGEVAIRKLDPPLSADARVALEAFADRSHAMPFNDSKWIAMRAFHRRNAAPSAFGYFCSELVAEAYQRAGLLPKPPEGMHSNNYIPADFSSTWADAVLPLSQGWRLDEEMFLKRADV